VGDPGKVVGVTNPSDRRTTTIGALLVAGGVLALLGGGLGLARATLLTAQIPYVVSGGIGGLLLIAVGLHLLVGSALGHERDRLEGVEAAILADGHHPGRFPRA
jgi:hypothetical protein